MYCGLNFGLECGVEWVGGLFLCIWVVLIRCQQVLCGVWCVVQWIVVDRLFFGFDFVDFGVDVDYGFVEGVYFGQVFVFGGFYYECIGYWKIYCWCVKIIVCQLFCDIVDGDIG